MKKDNFGLSYRKDSLNLMISNSRTLKSLIRTPEELTPTNPRKSILSPKQDFEDKKRFGFPPNLDLPNRSLNLEGTAYNTLELESILKQLRRFEEERKLLKSELHHFKEENSKLTKANKDLKHQNYNQQEMIENLISDLDRTKRLRIFKDRNISVDSDYAPKSLFKSMSKSGINSKEPGLYLASPKIGNASIEYSDEGQNLRTSIYEKRIRLKLANRNFYYKN